MMIVATPFISEDSDAAVTLSSGVITPAYIDESTPTVQIAVAKKLSEMTPTGKSANLNALLRVW